MSLMFLILLLVLLPIAVRQGPYGNLSFEDAAKPLRAAVMGAKEADRNGSFRAGPPKRTLGQNRASL